MKYLLFLVVFLSACTPSLLQYHPQSPVKRFYHELEDAKPLYEQRIKKTVLFSAEPITHPA
jgi:hypothetical protein